MDIATFLYMTINARFVEIKQKELQLIFGRYSPKNGYNTNNTVKFVTFPYEDQYNVTFDYVNLAVINPASGFGGTMRFFVIGLSVLGTAALLAMAYVFYKKRRVKATYAPRHGR